MLGRLPIAAEQALAFHHLFLALLAVTGLVLATVFTMLLVFAIRYRAGSERIRRHPSERSWRLEIAWSAATLLVFLALFYWGARLYAWELLPPGDAVVVMVVAQQWMWKVEHPDGQREIDELHVPLGEPTKLVMTSQDVIHSFSVPAFRLKRDLVPGRYESIWFVPNQTGEFHLFCTEFCGTNHAQMTGRVVVMPRADYERWLRARPVAETPALAGERLFRSLGCSGCHSAQSTVHAPELAGLFGRTVHLSDGSKVVADERYIRDSILLPKSEVVAGYAPVMPSFAGQIDESELFDLIAYIKSLGAKGEGTP